MGNEASQEGTSPPTPDQENIASPAHQNHTPHNSQHAHIPSLKGRMAMRKFHRAVGKVIAENHASQLHEARDKKKKGNLIIRLWKSKTRHMGGHKLLDKLSARAKTGRATGRGGHAEILERLEEEKRQRALAERLREEGARAREALEKEAHEIHEHDERERAAHEAAKSPSSGLLVLPNWEGPKSRLETLSGASGWEAGGDTSRLHSSRHFSRHHSVLGQTGGDEGGSPQAPLAWVPISLPSDLGNHKEEEGNEDSLSHCHRKSARGKMRKSSSSSSLVKGLPIRKSSRQKVYLHSTSAQLPGAALAPDQQKKGQEHAVP
mmetsp:Transcript_98241/g.225496  ORF Transcript_98241/g.225496 Transcript_98241/m.225496 type:complete len:320 (-) Transcript_98241:206-1165(-)